MSSFRTAVTTDLGANLARVENLIAAHVALSLDQYQQLALRTAKPLEAQPALEHAAMGLVSDAGELVSAVKAIEVYGKPLGDLDDPTSTRANLREECGDVLWFAAYAAHLHAVKLSEVATRYTMPHEDQTDTVTHRALRVVNCAVHCANNMAWPEHAHAEHALNHLALTLEYLERVMDCYGLGIQSVMQANLDKLRKRYPGAYSDAAAQARADKQEKSYGATGRGTGKNSDGTTVCSKCQGTGEADHPDDTGNWACGACCKTISNGAYEPFGAR